MLGYIAIDRKVKKHWIWSDPVKFQWWISILMDVSFADDKALIKGQLIVCKRGQSIKSLETWAKDWRTTKKTVSTFLKLLEKDGMIICENMKITTRLTVCNYDAYQTIGNAKETHGRRRVNAGETQTTPIINNKEVKEGEEESADEISFKKFNSWLEKHAPRVLQLAQPITCEQLVELKVKFKMPQITSLFESMHNYKPLLKNNVSAYLTFLKWSTKDFNIEGEDKKSGLGLTDAQAKDIFGK